MEPINNLLMPKYTAAAVRQMALCLCAITMTVSSWGQAPATTTVRGRVVDSLTQTPLEFASVAVTTAAGKAAGAALTNADGRFEIKGITAGRYTLSVSYVGYRTATRSIRPSGNIWDAGTLPLETDAVRLEDVSVSAIGNAMIVKKDTIEYRADAYKVTEGAMLEELVKKLDGAEIDSDGKITINGKEITKVMIDGKTFFSDDPQIATKNLPAAMVERVQVIDRKSDQAQFTGIDDGNEETVLNLTVRPGMKNGWFGNVSAGAGYEDRYQGGGLVANIKDDRQLSLLASGNNTNNRGFNDVAGSMMQQGRGSGGGSGSGGGAGGGRQGGAGVNVGGTRMNIGGNGLTTSWLGGANLYDEWGGRWKTTGNYFYNGSETTIDQRSYRQNLFQNDSTSYYNQQTQSVTQTQGHRAALEMEWTLDSLNSFLFKPSARYGLGRFDESTRYTTLNTARDSINDGYSRAFGDNTSAALNGDLLFRHKFATRGRTFSANVTAGYSRNVIDGNNASLMHLYAGAGDTVVNQQYRSEQQTLTASARLSYTEPLGNDYYTEVAYSVRLNHSTSDKDTYNLDSAGNLAGRDDNYSSHYRNLFVNQRAEVNLRRVREKYNWTMGIQAQPSYLRSEREGTAPLARSVVNFSPNGNFIYHFSDNRQFRADYRGTTNEPTITQLQPVPDNSNPLLERLGNPDLQPEFNNSLRLTYRSTDVASFRTTIASLNASYTWNKIVNNLIYESSSGRQVIVPANVEGVYSLTGFLMWSMPFRRGSRFSFTFNTFASYAQNAGLTQTVDRMPEGNEQQLALVEQSLRNTTRSMTFNKTIRLRYKGDKVDVNLSGRAGYTKAWYSAGNNPPVYWNNNVGGDFNWSLPYNLSLASDAGYTFYIGYPEGYNRPVFLWNAEASLLLFRQKQGTVKVRVFDILNQGRGVSRTTSDNYIEDLSVNTLGRYVMCSFIYRFGSFGGTSNFSITPERGRGRPMR
jgi:hypothetical protein